MQTSPALSRLDRTPATATIPVMATSALFVAALLALCPPAQARSASPEPATGFSGRIGVAMASVPTYEGSPNRRTLAGPDLTLRHRSRDWGTVEFGPRGLIWNAVEEGR